MSESGEISEIEEYQEEVEDPRQQTIQLACESQKEVSDMHQYKQKPSQNYQQSSQYLNKSDTQQNGVPGLQTYNIINSQGLNSDKPDDIIQISSDEETSNSDVQYVDSKQYNKLLEISALGKQKKLDTITSIQQQQQGKATPKQYGQITYLDQQPLKGQKQIKQYQERQKDMQEVIKEQSQQLPSLVNTKPNNIIGQDSISQDLDNQLDLKTNSKAIIQRQQQLVGVQIVPDNNYQTRNTEEQKLLRQPRYFDEGLNDEIVKRCNRCGEADHLARNCPRQKQVSCILCAQYGHIERNCPNKICFKCGRAGHVSRDCYIPFQEVHKRKICQECGQTDCDNAGKGDYFRFENGCFMNYLKEDLRHVRCFTCFRKGHMCCKEIPEDNSQQSCYFCGNKSHSYKDCGQRYSQVLSMERQQDAQEDLGKKQEHRFNQLQSQYINQEPKFSKYYPPQNGRYSQIEQVRSVPRYGGRQNHYSNHQYSAPQYSEYNQYKRTRIGR